MKKNRKCNLIEDLLPLYVEGIVSEQTKEEIEQHLKECDKCLQIFEDMRKDSTMFEIEQENTEEINNSEKEIKCIKKVKKKLILRIISSIFVSVIITLFVINIYDTYRIIQDEDGKYIIYNMNTGNIKKGIDGTNIYASYTIKTNNEIVRYDIIFTFDRNDICINARTILSGLDDEGLNNFKTTSENSIVVSNIKIEKQKLYMNSNVYVGKNKKRIIEGLKTYQAEIIEI